MLGCARSSGRSEVNASSMTCSHRRSQCVRRSSREGPRSRHRPRARARRLRHPQHARARRRRRASRPRGAGRQARLAHLHRHRPLAEGGRQDPPLARGRRARGRRLRARSSQAATAISCDVPMMPRSRYSGFFFGGRPRFGGGVVGSVKRSGAAPSERRFCSANAVRPFHTLSHSHLGSRLNCTLGPGPKSGVHFTTPPHPA